MNCRGVSRRLSAYFDGELSPAIRQSVEDPRGSSANFGRYVAETGVDALGCDTAAPLDVMVAQQSRLPVQGNLDPLLLLAGGDVMERRVKAILSRLSPKPFVFNLGHGILPETPAANVERLVQLVRAAD